MNHARKQPGRPADEPAPAALLAVAVDAARAAGAHALRNRHRRREVFAHVRHDVKLVLDRECQAVALDVIRAACPGHALLGEEDDHHDADRTAEGCEWIVDPIDGTVNFSHGLPQWCCSVAVRRGGEVLAGAVFAAELGELFTAARDIPSTRNGEPIAVSDTATLEEAIVLTGADREVAPGRPPLAYFTRLAERVQRVRVMGSAALDICRVATGGADGYFEGGIYIWDVAAAGLIVRQAGGRAAILERLARPHRLRFLAANPRIYDALAALLAVP